MNAKNSVQYILLEVSAAAQGLEVKITNEEMFRIDKNEFVKFIKSKKINTSITSLWISSLERDLKNF